MTTREPRPPAPSTASVRGDPRRAIVVRVSVVSPLAHRLRAIVHALSRPAAQDLSPWFALARDCDDLAEFWERAALIHRAEALSRERWFCADATSCRRCGAPPPDTFAPIPSVESSREVRCPTCGETSDGAAYRGRVPASWADAVLLACNPQRVLDGELLAAQANVALVALGEEPASEFAWILGRLPEWATLWNARPERFDHALSLGQARSRINPVSLSSQARWLGVASEVMLDVARELVSSEGWSDSDADSPERTAFAALEALDLAGVIYCGTHDGRALLRLCWALDDSERAALPMR